MSTVPNGVNGYHRVDIEQGIELGQLIGGEEHEGGEAEGGRELIYAEQEIHNLLEIRGLKDEDFWKVAEGEWEKSAKQFGDRVEGKKNQVLNVTNEIYHLVGFFSAFQGLLMTAVSQGTWLSCKNKGWVLTLSAFASVVTAAGVWQKNIIISDLQKTIDFEDPTRKVCPSHLTLHLNSISFSHKAAFL